MRRMKVMLLVCCVLLMLVVVSGCACEHEYGDWTVATPATCTKEGVEERACSKCGEKENHTLKLVAHTYGEWDVTKESTCAVEGTESRFCTNCNAKEERALSVVAHDYGKWTVTKKATCTVLGVKSRTCSKCDAKETGDVDKADHTYGSWETVKAATCKATGLKEKTCSNCGAKKTKDVDKADHTYSSWKIVKAATCTSAGSQEKTCSSCGKVSTKKISETGHDWKAATCVAPKTCRNCNKTSGSVTGHTAKSDGTCKTCGEKMTSKDYSYLAGNDFRSIKRKYSNAEAHAAYVILFTDENGDLCVLSYVYYKIISNYSSVRLHNLSTGKTIDDPDDYYRIQANRAFGGTKLRYLALASEVTEKMAAAAQGIADALESGKHSGAGTFVDAKTLNK